MAGDDISCSASLSTSSYETALCIIPPQEQCQNIDALRLLYDKGYGKWPPHINLIYPFVSPESLSRAKEQIESHFRDNGDFTGSLNLLLSQAGYFEHRANSRIFLQEPENASKSPLMLLRSAALRALGHAPTTCNFHMTVGQSEDNTQSSREFLLSKAMLIPDLSFNLESVVILVRERSPAQEGKSSRMRVWGTIPLPHAKNSSTTPIVEWWLKSRAKSVDQLESDDEDRSDSCDETLRTAFSREVQAGITYQFQDKQSKWISNDSFSDDVPAPTIMTVSSYNVLIDSEYPPARDRDRLLVEAILSSSGSADILLLQEVADDFLSYLLANPKVRQIYQFTTHAPPSQPDIGPLPSLRNVVILSKWPFSWKLVPFHRRHKGAVVATFPNVVRNGTPLVVAGVHLTCGLTDGSVAAKKVQVQNLVTYLEREHAADPWIVAGDFNITTSSYTIETALKNKSISQHTSKVLASIECTLTESGFLDAWSAARVDASDEVGIEDDDLFDGEEGATFNPRANVLAATTSGTSQNRPQRYDRILVRSQAALQVSSFNHFGLPDNVHGAQKVASDHSGIRASLRLLDPTSKTNIGDVQILQQHIVELKQAPATLSESSELVSMLDAYQMFPTDHEIQRRKEAFTLIKAVLLGSVKDDETSASDVPMVIVPVGSYALGVWTSSSDIDCLCIGSISSKTFFKLARQRIHKAHERGVRLLRKVEANSGTMFELSIQGVNMDLQYCPAARVVERWPEFHTLHPSDPIFNLPILSLRKLKPYRDISYIQRTIPSMSTFRFAYRCIKLWAVQRGIYSSRFGYLGGIHITLMLSWVYKRIAHDVNSVTAPDLITSFFHYYASFDWEKNMLFDAFFEKKKPRYHRTAREPMVVLGFHVPNSNVAHTSTAPGLRTLVYELRRADFELSNGGMTWDQFFADIQASPSVNKLSVGTDGFLRSYDSYVKIDVQYWGRTLNKGKGLVGWVESRCLPLVVDIHRALPNLSVRIWPARFTDTDPSVDQSDYHGCYVIGLSRDNGVAAAPTKEDRQSARQSIEKLFDRFLTQLHSDDKFYDPSTSWIGVSLAKASEIKALRIDQREWGDYVPDVDVDSDDEEEPDDFIDEAELAKIQAPRKLPIRAVASSALAPISSVKLRPASDVLHRLRWDANLDPSDYIVGYEDRFLGAKETTLERWKTEQTDDEFIPQHRILYFKRKDGEVVWERARRIDKIFGSGVSAGGGVS